MMPPAEDEVIDRLVSILSYRLSSPERRSAAARRPFDMSTGLMGDAFTAAAVYAGTGQTEWGELLEHNLRLLSRLLYSQRVDQMGLIGGLTGFLLLVENTDTRLDAREEIIDAVLRRIRQLSDNALSRLQVRTGAAQHDYSYAAGIAGVAHYLLVTGRDRRLSERICDRLADLSEGAFPSGFWTPVSELDEQTVADMPELSFGGRDLTFGNGLAGVCKVLSEGALVLGDERYREAASSLVDAARTDLRAHRGAGISEYQTPPLFGGAPGATPVCAQNWREGLPGWEFAVAGDRNLMRRLYAVARYDYSYLNADRGRFAGPGLCRGIAGRLYLADLLGLPDDPSWATRLFAQVRDYVGDAGEGYDPGFWDGFGGTAAVLLGRTTGQGYAPVLGLLGGSGLFPGHDVGVRGSQPRA